MRLNYKKNLEREDLNLEKFGLFRGISEESLSTFNENIEVRKYRKGTLLSAENKKAEHLYIVLEGLVKLFKQLEDRSEVIIHIKGKNDIAGNPGFIEDECAHLSAKAVTDIKVAMIPADILMSIIKKDPVFAQNTVEQMCRRLIAAEEKIKELSSEDSYSRVAKELLKFEDYYKMELENGTVFNLGISRSEFASIVGISREMVSRILSSFAESGIISVSGKNIRLLDREKLESWVL